MHGQIPSDLPQSLVQSPKQPEDPPPVTTSPPQSSPMRTLRPWGWYETIAEQPGHKVKRIGVLPGQQISLQKHAHRAEHWVVVAGLAWVTVDRWQGELAVGQHVDIPLGAVHRLANRTTGRVEIVEVQWGEHLSEDDIVRLQDDYGRGPAGEAGAAGENAV